MYARVSVVECKRDGEKKKGNDGSIGEDRKRGRRRGLKGKGRKKERKVSERKRKEREK